MKRKTLVACITCCIVLMYSSCYKTGEVIYKPECKPDYLTISTPLYNFFYLQEQNTFNGSLTYDINRRLISAITYIGSTPDRYLDFFYDGNNNLTKINESVKPDNNTTVLIVSDSFSYPFGTVNSLSSVAYVQLSLIAVDNFWTTAPMQTYNFNAQFQLISVYQGTWLEEQLTYDFGGNCLADSMYTTDHNVWRYIAYSGYDNQINPARSDRSLQLFFQMYNKNNPTVTDDYILGAGSDPSTFGINRTSTGSYTYNSYGYPITYGGNFFADYNCLPPPVSAPGPGAAK